MDQNADSTADTHIEVFGVNPEQSNTYSLNNYTPTLPNYDNKKSSAVREEEPSHPLGIDFQNENVIALSLLFPLIRYSIQISKGIIQLMIIGK